MPLPQSEVIAQLTHLMQQQIHQVNHYVEYLERIKQSISDSNNETLQQLLQNPPVEATDIEQNQQLQAKLLSAAGYGAQETALQQFIKSSQQQNLQTLHNALRQSLKRLQHILFVNSLLLQKNQHRIKQSIRLLAGHDLSSAPSSYSRQGNANNANDARRILAEA